METKSKEGSQDSQIWTSLDEIPIKQSMLVTWTHNICSKNIQNWFYLFRPARPPPHYESPYWSWQMIKQDLNRIWGCICVEGISKDSGNSAKVVFSTKPSPRNEKLLKLFYWNWTGRSGIRCDRGTKMVQSGNFPAGLLPLLLLVLSPTAPAPSSSPSTPPWPPGSPTLPPTLETFTSAQNNRLGKKRWENTGNVIEFVFCSDQVKC